MFKRLVIILSSLVLTTSCGEPNVLSEFSQKDGDESLFQEAQKKLDASEFSAAITILETKLTPAYRALNKVQDMRASSYAGRCGLTLFTFVSNLASSNNSTLFNFFMKAVQGKIVQPEDCKTAYQVMVDTYGDYSSRTSAQNFNIAILGMAQAGAYLRKNIDQDAAGLGDGALDAAKNICSAVVISDADVVNTFLGFGILLENITAISAELAGATVTEINDFKTQCGIALGFPGPPVPCALTDAAFITTNVGAFRSILNHPSVGAGSCGTDTPFTACPCDGM